MSCRDCEEPARFEIKTTDGWKPFCRKHAMRFGHWCEIRRVVAVTA